MRGGPTRLFLHRLSTWGGGEVRGREGGGSAAKYCENPMQLQEGGGEHAGSAKWDLVRGQCRPHETNCGGKTEGKEAIPGRRGEWGGDHSIGGGGRGEGGTLARED
eukprot:Sspe_Gene.91707::Locus_63294_Transcript_1_1_Confidence_1.000_Length_430::g.91707::m.91707